MLKILFLNIDQEVVAGSSAGPAAGAGAAAGVAAAAAPAAGAFVITVFLYGFVSSNLTVDHFGG